jgi:hypothetical protein
MFLSPCGVMSARHLTELFVYTLPLSAHKLNTKLTKVKHWLFESRVIRRANGKADGDLGAWKAKGG